MREQEECYAIIRIDNYKNQMTFNDFVVKKIVWDSETAESEVDRLNKLAYDEKRDCLYFWQYTRLTPRPPKAEVVEDKTFSILYDIDADKYSYRENTEED